MRTTAMLLAAVCLSVTAKAAAPSLMDNYAAASQAFMNGIVDNRQWIETYRNHVLSGINGSWIPLSLVQPVSLDDIKKVCGKTSNKITATSPYSFKMDRHFGNNVTLDYDYTYVIGNTFAEHVDVGKLVGALGLDSPQIASARLGVLSAANGQVTIFRPYEDVLVIQYAQRAPIIYGRCP